KSPVGMPGRAICNSFMRRVNAGEKIPHRLCRGCLKNCKPAEIPYCITDALIHAAKGEVEDALLFCGAYAYKAEKLETVKEVIDSLL
ncbi:MAG: nitronate monooxygenase, partial [Acetatifactor sp.]|nr:nitronate monooxygenase [Acetatifactor sp.]